MPTALNTTKELHHLRPRMAILPVGATEQHDGHLPLATDSLIVEAVSLRVAEKLGAYCLPVLPFSISHMNRGQRGTVYLRNATLAAVIRDLAVSLREDGFTEFVLLNGHGGNFILVPIVQDLNLDFPDLLTLMFKPSDVVSESGIFPRKFAWRHADESETACMLHLRNELVRRKELRDLAVDPDRELLRYFPFHKISRHTHTGCPTTATAEQGRRAIEFMVERTVKYIRDTLRKVARARAPLRAARRKR